MHNSCNGTIKRHVPVLPTLAETLMQSVELLETLAAKYAAKGDQAEWGYLRGNDEGQAEALRFAASIVKKAIAASQR